MFFEYQARYPSCPVCGAATSDFCRSKKTGEIVGCYECVVWADGWEEAETA